MKNKALPYIIFGVPILVGLFFVYKAVAKPKGKLGDGSTGTTDSGTTGGTTTPTTGGGSTTPTADSLPFKKGSRSESVKSIQTKLGISADGIFGTQTYNAVVSFQKSKGLVADGIVGAKTWKALFGADYPKMGNTSAEAKLSNKLASGDIRVGQSFNPLWV